MDHHSQFHPDSERTGDQLKKIFNKLACTNASSGNPNMPFLVQEAKAIRILTIEKTEGVNGLED